MRYRPLGPSNRVWELLGSSGTLVLHRCDEVAPHVMYLCSGGPNDKQPDDVELDNRDEFIFETGKE